MKSGLRLLFVTTVLCASIASGQGIERAGVLRGAVTDTAFGPLSDATVEVIGWGGKITTGESGRFEIRELPAGRLMLVVRHIGYAPVAVGIELAPRDTQRLSFSLERLRTALDTVRVTERVQSFRLAEFEERRKLRTGQYMDAEQIEKRNPVRLTDLLRTFVGVQVSDSPTGGGAIVARRPNSIQATCPVQAYVNGAMLPNPVNPNTDLPQPNAIAGMELYTGPSTIPLQYKSISGGGFCGVLLIWTK